LTIKLQCLNLLAANGTQAVTPPLNILLLSFHPDAIVRSPSSELQPVNANWKATLFLTCNIPKSATFYDV
jgi:hypothetical protein